MMTPGAIETDFGGGVSGGNREHNRIISIAALGRIGLPDDIGPMMANAAPVGEIADYAKEKRVNLRTIELDVQSDASSQIAVAVSWRVLAEGHINSKRLRAASGPMADMAPPPFL